MPKGVEADDHLGVVREPTATRPLGLKNTDVKTISGAIHHCIKREVPRFASSLQRGFIYGRNFLDNIVELDTWSRIFAMKSMDPHLSAPIMLFTDFGVAFPSIIHKWLFLTLRCSNLPAGLVYFNKGIYASVTAVGRAEASVVTLFFILSGVIQGCPLASFCFVVAFDPFLNLFDSLVVKSELGVVRACADDVGCAIVSLDILSRLAAV